MKSAFNYADCSTAEKLKVGCVLVKDDRIISIGYNGMPPGWSNQCETLSFFTEDGKQLPSQILITKPEVLHAEENAITPRPDARARVGARRVRFRGRPRRTGEQSRVHQRQVRGALGALAPLQPLRAVGVEGRPCGRVSANKSSTEIGA